MRQRVAIAIALLNRPKLIIADEPTTALDVTIQAQILYEAQKLCRESGTALIWITHDLSVVAGLADRICVMYAGRIVEQGTVDEVLDAPMHPYTHGLIGSVPSRNRRGAPLAQIPGMTPALLNLPPGCAFRSRCPRAAAKCLEEPALEKHKDRLVRCFYPPVRTSSSSSTSPSASSSRSTSPARSPARSAPTWQMKWCTQSTTSLSRCRKAKWWGWWASPAAASRRSAAWSPGSSSRAPARSAIAAGMASVGRMPVSRFR